MQRSKLRVVRAAGLLACLALVVLTPSALADTPASYTAENATNLWFVELSSAPTVEGTSLATTRAEKAAFRAEAREKGVRFTERFAFDKLWNGVSVSASRETASSLARLESVKAVYPVEIYTVPKTASVSPELATAIAMTGADTAQNELGLSGAGVKVAVMDTGIDYDHADLGGDGVQRTNSAVFPTARVTHGWDFVGDAFNAFPPAKSYNPLPVPDGYPDDCNSHGTHVAGIVGASGNPAAGGARGVAPGVTFGAYRVFGCGGSTTAEIMIAAMERALEDGMDVLNMSIGSAFNTWNQYPTAAASNRMVQEGMIVVASIGNSGASGVYSAGAPGVGKDVIGVASFDNSHVALNTFTISPDDTSIGYGNASAAPAAPTSGSLPMAKTAGATQPADDGCAASPAGTFTGKAVLIRRGTCTFHQKALHAQNAGAAAAVLYNNAAGRFAPTVAGDPAITIPVVAISDQEGLLIHNRLNSGPVTMTWTDDQGQFQNPTGGLISSFSSYGLGAELDLKPDIGGPGGLIRSTYPIELGSHATISGTSMSSPHVAGTVALLLEKRPSLKGNAAAVRSILQNSARPANWWGNPALGFLDNVHRQGAGMVRIDDAALATTRITPGKLALGESEAGPQTRTLTLANSGSQSVTYALSHVGALSTGGATNAPGFFTGFAAVAFGSPTVTVPAGGTATVDVTVTANPALADRSQYGGYIVFTPQGGGQTYRVPYAGFKGDYQSIQVLTPTTSTFGPFPKLGRHVGYSDVADPTAWAATYDSVAEGGVYTLATTTHTASGRPVVDAPTVLAHLEHQARLLRLRLVDSAGNLVGGQRNSIVYSEEYLPRSSTATAFSAFAWDGNLHIRAGSRTVLAPQPDGQYKLRLEVLKALGDPANPAHWETWTSPMFVLDRP